MPRSIKHSANRLPLHLEISEMLAREIQAGILLEGTKLAPERTMAQTLGVSVGTLRKALLDLERKQLIQRIHGSGNYVRGDNVTETAKANTIYGFFRLELIQGGGLPTALVVSVNRINKPKDIVDIGPSKKAYRIRRLRRLNDIDAAIEEIWLDADQNRIIRKSDLPDSLYLFYKEKLGFWITRATDSVGIGELPSWKPDTFGLVPETPTPNTTWGYIERTSFDQSNRCIEFSRTWFNPTTTRFIARWK